MIDSTSEMHDTSERTWKVLDISSSVAALAAILAFAVDQAIAASIIVVFWACLGLYVGGLRRAAFESSRQANLGLGERWKIAWSLTPFTVLTTGLLAAFLAALALSQILG